MAEYTSFRSLHTALRSLYETNFVELRTILKMQQLKKHQFLKTVALVRDSVHTICDVCGTQTHRLTRQFNLAAEGIPCGQCSVVYGYRERQLSRHQKIR